MISTLSLMISLVIGAASFAHDGVKPFRVVFSGISHMPVVPTYARILFCAFCKQIDRL